jgi:hypothetical protein
LKVENARLGRENKALRVRVRELERRLGVGEGEVERQELGLGTARSVGNLRRSTPEEFIRASERTDSAVTTT